MTKQKLIDLANTGRLREGWLIGVGPELERIKVLITFARGAKTIENLEDQGWQYYWKDLDDYADGLKKGR